MLRGMSMHQCSGEGTPDGLAWHHAESLAQCARASNPEPIRLEETKMNYVLPTAPTAAVPVAGGAADALFAVHRIYCVGRNYVEHAKEMGFTGREPPFFFLKPADAIVPIPEGTVGRMRYPTLTKELHHEVELVVAIGKGGRNIDRKSVV